MENTNATFINEIITEENYQTFANRLVINQLKRFLSNLTPPTEDMTAYVGL